jgi:lipopolysaccharide transport protein LptA
MKLTHLPAFCLVENILTGRHEIMNIETSGVTNGDVSHFLSPDLMSCFPVEKGFYRKLSALFLAMLLVSTPLPAQTDDSGDETPPPAGSTVITSDELHSDQMNHQSVFTGDVIAVGTNFRMTCQEMTVFFTNDNKVDQIVATGEVIITQPNRVTHCGHAVYTRSDDTFDLTDQPRILNGKSDQVYGTEIVINRTTQKMTVKGGRSTVILGADSMSTPATAPAAPNDTK